MQVNCRYCDAIPDLRAIVKECSAYARSQWPQDL